MFEAILTLCLADDLTLCRDALLPGAEAATEAACVAALPVDHAALDGLVAEGVPRCEPVPPPLPFEEVAAGVFVHLGRVEEPDAANGGDVANIGFVIGEEAVAVVDAGTTRALAEGVWRAIRARTELPVTHLVLTHVHPDHALGAPFFAEAGAEVVGHAALDRALADREANYLASLSALIGAGAMIGSGAVATDLAVADHAEIDLGGRVLELTAWKTAHSGTDLTVQDANTGTLFAGDLVFDAHAPALDGNLRGWQDVLGALREMEATAIVPGHGGPLLPWPEGGADTLRYLGVLARDTRAAIAKGTRLGTAVETIAASEAESWALFDAYNPRNATVAFTELEWE